MPFPARAPSPPLHASVGKAIFHPIAIITAVSVLTVPAIAQAGISGITVVPSDSAAEGTTEVDLTVQGNLDWAVFGKGGMGDIGNLTPTERKSGGAGFTSFEAIGGATDDTGGFNEPENLYRWTDGTATPSGDSTDVTFGRVTIGGDESNGTRLTIDVTQAGTYQLQYYASTFNLALDGSARLMSEGTAFNFSSPIPDGEVAATSLDDYIFTVDFVTTGADTLTLDVTNSSDVSGGAYAIEAFTFAGPEPPPNLDLGNVWPLGDSITDGVDGSGSRLPGGYRELLYTKLTDLGCDLNFVGTKNNNSSPLLTNLGQDRHDGHSGWTIADIDGRSGLYEQVSGWHAAIPEPDIILLLIGINDLNHDRENATALDRLDLLITRLLGLDPTVRILVSTLPDAEQDNPYRGGATNDIAADVASYNAAMLSMVAGRRAMGQNVELVDMHAVVTLDDLDDGLHPNATGYMRMAELWKDAILQEPPSFTTNGIIHDSGMMTLEASGALGTSYSLWTAEDLTNDSWTLLRYDSIRTNPFIIMDESTSERRFYRFSAP